MTRGTITSVIHRLRQVALRDRDDLTDGQLLGSFVAERTEDAFAALVGRHGAMVLGVCLRILGNAHDAEDAFQATFLVLVRKADALVDRRTVGDWLYGVAYHTALKARAASGKRRVMEQRYQQPGRQCSDAVWRELEELLDQELSGLPEKYRAPLVLCDLEGVSRKEVARQLGCPEGTVSGRLARARVMLSKRLSRRGVTVSGGLLAVALSTHASATAVPVPLLQSTIQAASCGAASQAAAAGVITAKVAALTQGVLKAMFLTKLKLVTGLLLALSLSVGALLCGTAEGQGPGKGGKKPQIVEVDLNKLPPDLAQQIRDSLRKADQAKSSTKQAVKKDNREEGQSGFQGEQQGQHEDKDPPAKAKGNAGAAKGKKGENEERDERGQKTKGKEQGRDRDERGERNEQSGFQGEQKGEHEDKPTKGKAPAKGNEPAKGKGGEGGKRAPQQTNLTVELERRLERLMAELEALRRELRKK